jgi:hypothetical protein
MRTMWLALVVMVLAAASVTASVAVADPGNGVPTVQFAVDYAVGPYTVTCKGQRIVTTGKNASVRDRETCTVDTQSFLAEGTYTVQLPDGNPNTFSWYSDYEWFVNPGGVLLWAVSGTVKVSNRPDGTQVWQAHVTY